jgi:hypothetical protein
MENSTRYGIFPIGARNPIATTLTCAEATRLAYRWLAPQGVKYQIKALRRLGGRR